MNRDELEKKYSELKEVLLEYTECKAVKLSASDITKHLFEQELNDHGIKTEGYYVGTSSFKVNDFMYIARFGESYRRTIGVEVNNKKPREGEILLCIRFPTGAYIFSKSYPKAYFNNMMSDLIEAMQPKYIDMMNNALYITLDKSAEAINIFNEIYAKYMKGYKEFEKIERIKKLKEELEQLEEKEPNQ